MDIDHVFKKLRPKALVRWLGCAKSLTPQHPEVSQKSHNMDASAFTATLQDQAAANRAACVEREATVFDSVFTPDGAFLISGAPLRWWQPLSRPTRRPPPLNRTAVCAAAGSSTGRIAVSDVGSMVRTKGSR